MTPPRPRFPVWSLVALPVAGFLAFIAVGAGLAQDRPSPLPRESRIDPDAVKNQAPHRPAAEDRPMVRYEIRFIVGPSEGWRKLLLPRIKLVKQEADFAAWSLDDRALTELLTFAQSHTTTKVLSAPKVLVDDGAKATVKTRSQRFYVADVESTDEPAPGFRPVIKSVDEGITLGMTGLIRPHATRLSVEVVEEAVLGFHTMGREKRVGDRTISGQYQIPTTAKRSWQLDTEIPEGAQLLISLGLRDETRSLSDVASLANGILARVGLPEYPPATLTMEAMVLIMPRHATPEDPKPSARSGSRSTASANGLGR